MKAFWIVIQDHKGKELKRIALCPSDEWHIFGATALTDQDERVPDDEFAILGRTQIDVEPRLVTWRPQ